MWYRAGTAATARIFCPWFLSKACFVSSHCILQRRDISVDVTGHRQMPRRPTPRLFVWGPVLSGTCNAHSPDQTHDISLPTASTSDSWWKTTLRMCIIRSHLANASLAIGSIELTIENFPEGNWRRRSIWSLSKAIIHCYCNSILAPLSKGIIRAQLILFGILSVAGDGQAHMQHIWLNVAMTLSPYLGHYKLAPAIKIIIRSTWLLWQYKGGVITCETRHNRSKTKSEKLQ